MPVPHPEAPFAQKTVQKWFQEDGSDSDHNNASSDLYSKYYSQASHSSRLLSNANSSLESEQTSSSGGDYAYDNENDELEPGSLLKAMSKGDKRNEVLVAVDFHSLFTIRDFPHPLHFSSRRGYISRTATREKLQEVVLYECASARRKVRDTMGKLYNAGLGVRMESWVDFQDERKLYANSNQHRKSRFGTVGDLFSPTDTNDLPIRVEVSLFDLNKPSKPSGFPGLEDRERGVHWIHSRYRDETLVEKSIFSKHKPQKTAVVTITREDKPKTRWARKVPCRMINGVRIGSSDVGFFMDPEQRVEWVRAGQSDICAFGPVNTEPPESWGAPTFIGKESLPQEPQMTFQEYQSSLSSKELPHTDIHLAIRMVYRCSDIFKGRNHFLGPDYVLLPANTLMILKPGRSTQTVISKNLTHSLHQVATQTGCNLEVFMDPHLRGRWKFDLWVLPQKGPKVNKAGKLYRFNGKTPLKWFLDKEMCDGEDGPPTMYMEAHMVPNGKSIQDVAEAERSAPFRRNQSGMGDGEVVSDDDEDEDELFLLQKD